MISVIISARNESPQIVWTIYSIIQDLELTGKEWEIILVDNGSLDDTSDYLRERGMFINGKLKILYDPIMGNVSARNKGVAVSRGEYIFFADAHLVIKRGTFNEMIKALDEYDNAIVHPAIDWLGSYPPEPSYQYTLCLGEKFWGRWNKIKISDKPFAIPLSGHCFLGLKRKYFDLWGGYNPHFRAYGGGENYLNLKWWLFGGITLCIPSALVWHSRFKRGYIYYGDDLIHNQMLSAYTVAGEKWAERVLISQLNKDKTKKEILMKLYEEATNEGKDDREFILKNQIIGFDDLLKEPLWDKWNDNTHHWHKSYILIFDDWINNLKTNEAKEFYNNSLFQK